MFKYILLLPLVILQVDLCFASDSRRETFAIRISCGSQQNVLTDARKALWLKDYAYTGGKPANATRTSLFAPPLSTLRHFTLSDGPENCYNIDGIYKGRYSVRFFFALVSDTDSIEEPLFDISIEGTQIYSLAPGWSRNDEQSFAEVLVSVKGNSLSLCFHSTGHGDPSILSIEILEVDDDAYLYGPKQDQGLILRTIKRLNCGYEQAAFDEDYNNDSWGGDRFWGVIKTLGPNYDRSISTEKDVKRATVPPNFYPQKIYQSAIIGTDADPGLAFSMDVLPKGIYSIWLHFAEIDYRITSMGQRIFDIIINGDVAFKNVDIIELAGDGYTALVLNKTIISKEKTLTITLNPSSGSYAIVNAIEILEVVPAESKTSSEEVMALQNLKNSLVLPSRFGWNGDPCVPQAHPWSGVYCRFNNNNNTWVIDGLELDNQGLMGILPDDFSILSHLHTINFSGNAIHGSIPSSLGGITSLETLDLSYNLLNGSVPESLGQLKLLKILNLKSNLLSGRIPATLEGRPLYGSSFDFSSNAGLCGLPGLPSCDFHLSSGAKETEPFEARKMAQRDAPYAKSRTHFAQDVQITKSNGQDASQSVDN